LRLRKSPQVTLAARAPISGQEQAGSIRPRAGYGA